MHKIRPRRCLGGRGRDCQRCGKPLITARGAAIGVADDSLTIISRGAQIGSLVRANESLDVTSFMLYPSSSQNRILAIRF
jgi:hypothetical protein